jgi:hypothetical protein
VTSPRQILIDPLSAQSLIIETSVKGQSLGTATGFVVESGGEKALITNWHVVAGRNPDTDQLLSPTGAVPDQLHILHHATGNLGQWAVRTEDLFSARGRARWLEHSQGRVIDVIALPLAKIDAGITIYPFDLGLAATDMIPEVAMPISIIGYPFGMRTGGSWPIWKTGHIASDPDLDYDGRPAFLIDATTRGGMSGSPVVLRMTSGFKTRTGTYVLAAGMSTLFLGVYSGRIHDQSEIGRVWRPSVIDDLLGSL